MVRPMTTLQSVLRNQLGQTATKEGCRQGGCGELHRPRRRRADAVVPAPGRGRRRPAGHDAREPDPGRGPPPDPAGIPRRLCLPVRLLHARAWSCVSKALLDHDPDPSADDIGQALTGNICRCTGYGPIVEAIGRAAERDDAQTTERSHDERRRSTSSAGRSSGATGSATSRDGRVFTADRDVPGHAPPQDGPQPAPPRPDPAASTCPRPSACPASSGP